MPLLRRRPRVQPGSRPPRPAAEATAIDGTYRQLITATDLRRAGFTDDHAERVKPAWHEDGAALDCLVENAGTLTYVFDKGTYTLEAAPGWRPAGRSRVGLLRRDGDVLTIVDDLPTPEGLPFVVRFRWARPATL